MYKRQGGKYIQDRDDDAHASGAGDVGTGGQREGAGGDGPDEVDAAIDKLAGLGVINSPDYWKNAVAGGKVAYLDILFTQAAAKITKAGPRTADVKSGVDALVKAGVINTPEYWLQNYGKLQSLDLLLCALGGAV